MQHNRVLIIDDDEEIRQRLADALASEGYSILTVENGQRALDILLTLDPEELPDCIILDLMMPIMDGRAFIETLARDHAEDFAKIPIIVATAMTELPFAQSLPIVEVLRKPFKLETLLETVERYC